MSRKPDDFSGMKARQRVGYRLVRLLGVLQEWVWKHVIGEYVWRSADGRCVPVSKMSDEHLMNALRMLMRTGDQREKLAALSAEYTRRLDARRRQ